MTCEPPSMLISIAIMIWETLESAIAHTCKHPAHHEKEVLETSEQWAIAFKQD
jgi:gamma-glutamyl phosphate reductase